MNEEKEWKYWNNAPSFQLFQGMSLRRGFLPVKNLELLTYEDGFNEHHHIKTMADFEEDFAQLLSSIRADKVIGVEFRKLTNFEAALAHIPKDMFLEHCRKCGLSIHKNLSDNGGRPRHVVTDELEKLADEYCKLRKSYEDFLKAAAEKFDVEQKTVKNQYAKKRYLALSANFPK